MTRGMHKSWFLVFLATLCMASTAGAQRSGGGGPGGLLGLALMDSVLKELGLEGDAAKLAEIRKLAGAASRELQESARALREESWEKKDESVAKIRAKYDPELRKLLSAEQFARLQQISWQIRGPDALTDPDVVRALEMTVEQKDKLAALNRKFLKDQRALFDEANRGGAQAAEVMKRIDVLVAERKKAVEEALSKAQQTKFTELQGKPFELNPRKRSLENKADEKK